MSVYCAPPTPPAGLPPTNTRNYTPDPLRGNTLGAGELNRYKQQAAVRKGEPSRRAVQLRTYGQASANAAGVMVCDLGDAYQG